ATIRATAITPIMTTAIIRAPITIIGPTSIAPILTITGATGIEAADRLGDAPGAQPTGLPARPRHYRGLSNVRWQRPHGSGARPAGRGGLRPWPAERSGHCAGLVKRLAPDG